MRVHSRALLNLNSKFVYGLRVCARWMCLPLFAALAVSPAVGQTRGEVAITVDDLPVHGDLPANTTRAEIARMNAAAREDGVSLVYPRIEPLM